MLFKILFIILSLGFMVLANDDEPSARIIGGKIAPRNTYNYMVNIINKGDNLCGGSLIAKDTVITAGHCINGTRPEYYNIRGKVHNAILEDGEELRVTKIIVHPNYDSYYLDNDIALIKVDPNHSIDSFLNLDTSYTARVNTRMLVTGWGRIRSHGKFSDELKELDIKVINPSVCSRNIRPLNSYSHFCATGVQSGSSVCQGDSGSPVVTKDLHTIVGIVSYGTKACNKPSVAFTRVSSYVGWIRKYTNLGSGQTSRPGFVGENDKSNPKPNAQYPLGNCGEAGDNICFKEDRIGICITNRSAYPFNCPKGTTCKFDNGKAYCAK